MEQKMVTDDKSEALVHSSNKYTGPLFEDSDAYKTVSLQLEDKLIAGQKKEAKRQKRMEILRESERHIEEDKESKQIEKDEDILFFKL